jgi:uncharacterized membrane protein YbhN (UPF0104 family)
VTEPEASPRIGLGPRARWAVGAFVVVSLVFITLLVVRHLGDVAAARADLRSFGTRIRPAWLALSLGLATFNLFLMAGVWSFLMRALGPAVSTREATLVWTTTNLGRYVPGKIWQLTGLAAWMRVRTGAGGAALVAAAAFQLLVLATGAVAAVIGLGGASLRSGAALPVAAGLAVALIPALLRPSLVRRGTAWLARRLGEPGPTGTLSGATIAGAVAGLLVAWAVYGLSAWALWHGVGADGPPGPVLFTGAFAAAYIAGYLAFFSPGGLVVREGALAALLATAGGVPLGIGGAFAVVARLWSVVSELLAAGLAWVWNRQTSRNEEGGG